MKLCSRSDSIAGIVFSMIIHCLFFGNGIIKISKLPYDQKNSMNTMNSINTIKNAVNIKISKVNKCLL